MLKNWKVLWVIIAILVGVVGVLSFSLLKTEIPTMLPSEDLNNTACTMEARQCPDGSWVGRTGPNCEFTPCPGE